MRFLIPLLFGACIYVFLPAAGYSQDNNADHLAHLLMDNRALREAAKKKLLAGREQRIARLLQVVNRTALREKNREAVVAAIEILGELRAQQAAPFLVRLLLFGHNADVHDAQDRHRVPLPPNKGAPAVEALISIGMPSLKPVTEELLAIREKTHDRNSLHLHCLWVIKGVLGPRLAKAYLRQLSEGDERARNSRLVKSGFHFMDRYMFEED